MKLTSQTSLGGAGLSEAQLGLLKSLWITSLDELVSLTVAVGHAETLDKTGLPNAGALLSAAKHVLPPERLTLISKPQRGGGLGCLLDPQILEDFKHQGYVRPVTAGPSGAFEAKLPTSVRLVSKLPAVRDQGQRGTCVAFGTVALREFLSGGNIDLSEQFLYWACKELDGFPEAGTYIHTAMTALAEYGVCEEPAWPYCPNQTDNEGQGPPPKGAKENAKKYRLASTRTVEPNLVVHYKNVLAGSGGLGGMPVTFATLVFDSWYMSPETHRTGKITMPLPGEQPVGGHAWCVVGYVDEEGVPGGGYFIVRNSWGARWAPDSPETPGHAVMPYEYVKRYAVEAFTGPVRTESSIEEEANGEFAGYLRRLASDGRDVEGKLVRAGTRVLYNATIAPGEFKEDTPGNQQEFKELGFGWTVKTRQAAFFTLPNTFSASRRTQIEQVKAAKEKFSSAIHENVAAIRGRPFPRPTVPFYYHFIPFEWEPKIERAGEVGNLTAPLVEHLKRESGSPDGLPWPDDLAAVLTAVNDARVYRVERGSTAIHIVAAFVAGMALKSGEAPSLRLLDHASMDALQQAYENWLTTGRHIDKPIFVFFTVGAAQELPQEMSPLAKGDRWVVLSYPTADGKWETRTPRRFGDRLAIRYFIDDLRPETAPQRASKIKDSVDGLLVEFDGNVTVSLVAKRTGYRKSLVVDAFYVLQDRAGDTYHLYHANGELAVRRARPGEKASVKAPSYWRVSIRKHALGILGVGVGFVAWRAVEFIPWIPSYIGPWLAVVFGYVGGQIQKFVNQRASQGKE